MTYFKTDDGLSVLVTGNKPFHFFSIDNYLYTLGLSGENVSKWFLPENIEEIVFTLGTVTLEETIALENLLKESGFEIKEPLETPRVITEDQLFWTSIKYEDRSRVLTMFWPNVRIIKLKLKKSEITRFLNFINSLENWKTVYASREKQIAIIK